MKPESALDKIQGQRTTSDVIFEALQHRQADRLGQAAKIATAFFRRNNVPVPEVARLIASIHQTLTAIATPVVAAAEPVRSPAVAIDKALRPDCVRCVECGREFKSLKRHIFAAHGLDPDQYRERWGLPSDYPMVCPAYSKKRSGIALTTRLGRKKTK